ncbi:MAG: FtsX-like permease family protein [Bacilli bacterium]|nr:FtsX-like permease family protein [Bacilli bacterium]
MIKILFKPFFKKYVGLFISMVFISLLSISLLCSFASTIINLQKTYKDYLNEYGKVDAVVKTSIATRDELAELKNVEGVEEVDLRLTLDARLLKSDGRSITSRIITFSETENNIFNRYIIDKTDRKAGEINVSVVRKFALNNNLKVGDHVKVGYFKTYINLYINEIIETPESIQSRANDYVWSDGTDFGFIYISETELDKVLYDLSLIIEDKIENDPEFKAYYEEVKDATGLDIPDLTDKTIIGKNFASKFANQILVKAKDGYTESEVCNNVNEYLKNNEVTVKQASEAHQLFYILYLENCIKQLRVASIFLPVFFYLVTMIIIILFMNQIVKSMTRDIGVMMSIGVGFTDIRSLFLFFTLLMSIISSILGIGLSLFLSGYLIKVMRHVYSLPTLPQTISIPVSIAACIGLFIFAEIATLISCRGILRITPKDATLSNETKRKPIPKAVAKFIDKAPMAIKLGVNSIFQNMRRFLVSVFSIFAAFIIIILALFFYVSKTELMDQSVERRLNFDVQVYFTEVATEETKEKVKTLEYVTAFEDCYYTYVQAEKDGTKVYLECLAFDPNSQNDLVKIPDKKGFGEQELKDGGIIIPKTMAKKLYVKVGDSVKINNHDVLIIGISNEYFHPITYLSKDEMDRIGATYVTSFLMNVSDEKAILQYFDDEAIGTLSVFTRNLSADIHGIFNSVDVFIYIMIGFSLGMAFIILVIMSQNALMEQQRQITVYRAIGFRIINISNLWTLQSVSQLIISTIFGIPAGYLASAVLFKLCSSDSQSYPIIFSTKYASFAFLFIFTIILITHGIAMISIRSWNIADNTRSRE